MSTVVRRTKLRHDYDLNVEVKIIVHNFIENTNYTEENLEFIAKQTIF